MDTSINNIIIRYGRFNIKDKPTKKAVKERFKPLKVRDIDIDICDYCTAWEVFLTIVRMNINILIDDNGYFADDIDERIINAVHNATGIAKELLEFVDCNPVDS